MQQYLMLAAMALVFYFFMAKPQYDKQKKQRNFLASIKKGDKIVSIGGINGTIFEIKDRTVTLELDDVGTRIILNKEAISYESTKKLLEAQK